jgi:hypothetical protein
VIPGNVFLDQPRSTGTRMVDLALPVAHVGVYNDSTKRGKPTAISSVVSDSFTTRLEIKPGRFEVTINQIGCHGIALIDRIE